MGLKRILEQLARTNPERCLNTVYLHIMLYVIMESDLRTISSYNKLCKYADDTNLLVPQNSDTYITSEYEHVKKWAVGNKMIINREK